MTQRSVYTHGHQESVLRAHSWRTAENSAAYLLDSLQPHMHILDIGCGPGTITADLARLVPQGRVTGIESVPDVLEQARATARERGVQNIEFVVGDIHALEYPDDTFDVVHVHQVLQHVSDPVKALSEMRRVAKPGGIVAVRESDFSTMTWFPENEGISDWLCLYDRVARFNGGEPNAARRLLAWVRLAGYDRMKITTTASAWCYSTPEERAWWGEGWAERTVSSSLAKSAVKGGLATKDELVRLSEAWRQWTAEEDGWVGLLHGEILYRV